mmetsp:Transcript_26386/g.40500  ORF Transcript_26386/g.40500 Transcript_26386/m.40500 type:complete len:412 (-) Transcript_26386:112-1347(-)
MVSTVRRRRKISSCSLPILILVVYVSIFCVLSAWLYTIITWNYYVQEDGSNTHNLENFQERFDGRNSKSNNDHPSPRNHKKPCALLFFGLVKDFETLAYPSIRQNIIANNPKCDIFLHTYNITFTPVNPRNNEPHPFPINASQAYLLTNNVTMDTEESFLTANSAFLNHSRKFTTDKWGSCCQSHDNMIRQWFSIKGVWDLMEDHERKALARKGTVGGDNDQPNHNMGQTQTTYYDQVGLFRLDLYYPTPIDIFESNASMPDFALFPVNDRLFYGLRTYASIWAHRLAFVDIFETQYMNLVENRQGYHSEYFLHSLLQHYHIPYTLSNTCAWRIRNGPRLQITDCDKLTSQQQPLIPYQDIPSLLPAGYILNDKMTSPQTYLSICDMGKRLKCWLRGVQCDCDYAYHPSNL